MKRKNPFENNNIIPFTGKLPDVRTSQGVGDLDLGAMLGRDMPDIDEMTDEELSKEFIHAFIETMVIRKKDWTSTHPNHIVCGCDDYYANLANEISISLFDVNLPKDSLYGIMHEIAMSATAYLEDLVSGFGVWNAFRNLYRKKYGKWLPFYDCEHDDYLLDNVNIEDVKYIVWDCFCRCGQVEEIIYSPYSEAVERIACIVYDILEIRYEDAPESTRVRDFIRRVMKKGDYFEMRILAEWLLTDNKLISAPNMAAYIFDEADSLQESEEIFNFDTALYFVRSIKAWNENIGPLGCSASVYLAEMCREAGFDAPAVKLDNLECIDIALFRVKEVGKKVIVLEDATGQCYDVEKNSFGKGVRFNESKGYLTSIVRFGDLWRQNGMASGFATDPFEKKNLEPIYHKNGKSRKLVEEIVERNGGKRIFYCRDMEAIKSILGFPYDGDMDADADIDNYVVMLSDDEGIVVIQNYAHVFKDKDNPFYNKKVAKKDALGLIADGTVPEDIARIIVEKKMLPDAEMNASQGKRFGKAIMQDNLLFLFGFYRSKNPEIYK